MRFKKCPQLPGAGRTRVGHHHGNHTPTSPEAVLLGKMACHTKQIRRQCSTWDLKLWYWHGMGLQNYLLPLGIHIFGQYPKRRE